MARALTLDAQLDVACRQGDPDADAAVLALGSEVWAVNALLSRVASDDEPLPAGVPDALRPLLRPELPAWADVHRIRSAQSFAEARLASITVALFCAALPASYAAARGASVLASTGRLRNDLDRRVNETARFVLQVLEPNAFDPGGGGRTAIGKVRLVHAAVRRSLSLRSADAAVPINQEDMLATVGLFSVTVLDALARLGVSVHPRDRDDFVHLWSVVGAMLGVREDLLAQDYVAAKAMLDRIRARNVRATEEGRVLMRELLDGLERHACLPQLRDLPRELVHHLLGPELADVLGVQTPRVRLLRQGVSSIDWERAHARLGRRVLDAVTWVKLGGRPATFAMPTGAS